MDDQGSAAVTRMRRLWARLPQGERRRTLGLVLILGAFLVVHWLPFVAGLVLVGAGFALYASTIRFIP